MSGPRGTFAAIPFKAHHSPPLANLRAQLGPLHDVYFYRAMLWCKEYLRSGRLEGAWSALASFVQWPDDAEALAIAFRLAGVVSGEHDDMWEWDEYNGWLIRRAKEESERKRKERQAAKAKSRAGVKSGKARRRKAKQLALLPTPRKPRQRPLFIKGRPRKRKRKPWPDPAVVASQSAKLEQAANNKETPES